MLYSLLDKVVARIEDLDPQAEAPRFASQLRSVRTDLFERLEERIAQRTAHAIAARVLQIIKEIPFVVGFIRNAVDQQTTHPSVRCAMVGSLAYLVQPRDLLPDDLPGGYGFIDDSVILRATVSEYFDALPPDFTDAGRERAILQMLGLCIPPRRISEFQAALDGVWHLFQRLMLLSPQQVDGTIRRLMDRPLEIPLPQLEPAPSQYSPGPDLKGLLGEHAIRLDAQGASVVFGDGTSIGLNGKARIQ